MSIHLHFRAVAETGIRDDHAWLAAFMSEAWDRRADEHEAGVSTSFDKVSGLVAEFYSAAEADDRELPVHGGRPVANDTGFDPPLMLMDAPEVSRAARFLTAVSFDDLWRAAGPRFRALCPDEESNREEFRSYHHGLRAFYAQAASAGHAVVKAVWA
ncbi:hypothetical protein SLA_4792 [Streptomyces laurentii]|uniref:DUF1877 domain containing protein n=1 Tax=Streptomyces laurentii TaxID=39478 RepID=A0A160P433_STRLU|nr:hypothetical protein SLA_4792 [Streptomyces laurentii]